MSVPRLESLAAVVNARSLKFVVESLTLKVDWVVCWIDSMVTLQWIRGSRSQWKAFVANHVAEIQSTCNPQHWKHFSGKDNPADLLMRGLPAKVLADSKLWWGGLCWLSSQCLPDQPELLNELTKAGVRGRYQCKPVKPGEANRLVFESVRQQPSSPVQQSPEYVFSVKRCGDQAISNLGRWSLLILVLLAMF